MLNRFFKLSILALALGAFTFTACQKEDVASALTTDEYVDQALYLMQDEGNIGRHGCYELVFPISVEFPDGTTVTAENYEEMGTAIRTWRENHDRRDGHPTFVFPFEVMSQDGDIISVGDRAELRRLREACGRDYFNGRDFRGHRDQCTPCFHLTFPVTIEFPDETTATANSRQELKMLVRQWRQDNPDVDGRPHLTFPITVQMTETDELVTVNSREELQALRESCN